MTAEDKSQTNTFETEFEKLYERSVKELQAGQVIKGTVVEITDTSALIDIGYKSEGHISLNDLRDKDGNLTVKTGDEISVFLVTLENENGNIVLSKSRADQIKVWEAMEKSYEEGKNVTGKIIQRVKGGFHVDIDGITAFLPNSQVDLRPVRNPEKLIGTHHEFRVLKYSKPKNNVVISRRVLLEADRDKLRLETLSKIEEGAIVEGIVKNITDYGAFIDLGGIDGLVHLTELSWGKVSHPSQILKTGDKIKVKVLNFNKEENKIFLGLKQTMPDPWQTSSEKYPVGSRINGRVVNVTDYGGFVEVEDGLEGLIHVSEMSWTKLRHPSQKLKVGDEVEVMVLDIDTENRRMSLGLKQTEANPWEELDKRYPKGSRVKGVIKNMTDFGVFIGVEEGIDGLVHISDLSWKKVKHPSEIFKKGQEVEAVVLSVDKNAQRFSLSTKLIEKNPWESVGERYKPGMILEGTVTGIADFGAFVEIEEGLEGLVHISELNRGKKKGTEVGEGALVEVEVLNVDSEEKKIGLSIRGVKVSPEKVHVEEKEEGSTDRTRRRKRVRREARGREKRRSNGSGSTDRGRRRKRVRRETRGREKRRSNGSGSTDRARRRKRKRARRGEKRRTPGRRPVVLF
jgi:small subunit ribosomal protein S1